MNAPATAVSESKLLTMFQPVEILGIKCPNRIMATPSVENQADTDGSVIPGLIRHYTGLARDGAGSIIVESAYVARQGRGHQTQLGISEEEHLDGLARLVQNIKCEGAAVGLRLSHAGAKTSEEVCNETPIGPSVYNFGRDYDVSREFDLDDCEEIVLHFVHAAERAQEVGADFVEINGGDQLLLDQCFSLKMNGRDDEYGPNDIESRLRLGLDIVRAIRDRESITIPIAYYFSIMDKIEDGFSPEDLGETVRLLEEAGVNIFHPLAIHAMNQCFDSKHCLMEWVGRYTERTMIAEGNIKSPQLLQEASELNRADWYTLERGMFTRPQWYGFLKRKLTPPKS